jgi:hypothetical protein
MRQVVVPQGPSAEATATPAPQGTTMSGSERLSKDFTRSTLSKGNGYGTSGRYSQSFRCFRSLKYPQEGQVTQDVECQASSSCR